jgi:hypothetical protein
VQSAHVSVSARPARFQRIRAVNFRLVGENLGDDLSRIGSSGFQFAVEYWTASEQKSVIFQANSLFEVIELARPRANARANELAPSERIPCPTSG